MSCRPGALSWVKGSRSPEKSGDRERFYRVSALGLNDLGYNFRVKMGKSGNLFGVCSEISFQ